MDPDDPFSDADNDRTVIRPTPGRRSPGDPSRPSPTSPDQTVVAPHASADPAPYHPFTSPAAGEITGAGLNPVVDAATALLVLAGQLRNTASLPDVAGLREHVLRQIGLFEQKARAAGVSPEGLLAARYTLCTLLDEFVLKTPWGSESVWSSQSLLSAFHNETWGGEKFFQILERMSQDPARNIDQLELMNICLLLGFEGKYSVMEQGAARLGEIKDNLFSAIRIHRGDIERELSPHWKGIQKRQNLLVRYVPLWVVGALAGVLLLVTYAGFRFILESTSSPVYDMLDVTDRPVVTEKK